MNWQDRITSDRSVLLGKPAIKGTRLSVEFILDRFADGWTEQEMLDSYPRITKEDIQAVFKYASDCMKDGLLFEMDLDLK